MSDEMNEAELPQEAAEGATPEIDPVEAVAQSEALMSELADEPAADADFEKSSDELAAEAAMLAELEAMDSEDDEPDSAALSDSADEAQSPFPQVSVEQPQNLQLLMDVSLQITVELGRREMLFGDVLQLGKGSLVELNKIADEPVDIYVNRSKIAEGEVVVVDDHFGVRITRLLNPGTLKGFA